MHKLSVEFGPTIGHFMGHPIPETLHNADGTFVFARIAEYSSSEEGYPLDQLDEGERLFANGLVYRRQA